MVLEIITLLVLISVLLIKYGTWRHTNALTLELASLEKLYRYHGQRYKMMKQKREAGENDEQTLRRDRLALDSHLTRLETQLKEENDRNSEMEDHLR